MTGELEILVNPATQALLTAMMTDGWSGLKRRFATLFSPGRRGMKHAEQRLENTRAIILADPNSETVRAQVASEWEEEFRRLVLENPNVASPLRQLINDVSRLEGNVKINEVKHVKQQAEARDNATVFQQGAGNQYKIN